MSRRLLALTVMLLVFAGGSALAHKDPHSDPTSPDGAKACDTWWRDGYDDNGDGVDNNTHHEVGTNDPILVQNYGGPDDTGVILESGHYVVYGDSGYVEVVGGQGYARPEGSNGARGGWVQGEVDNAAAPTDVDFLVGTFVGSDPNPTLGYTEKDACLNVANMRVVDLMDCKNPPLKASDNCPEHN